MKTTIQLSNIFPKELPNTNLKWSTSHKETLDLKSKIHKPIIFLKTKLFIISKCKTICSENNWKEKESSTIEKFYRSWNKKISKDPKICWKTQCFHLKWVMSHLNLLKIISMNWIFINKRTNNWKIELKIT